MLMRMLEAGGMPVESDGVRSADANNPRGYWEDERVKQLDKGGDKSWLRGLRGRAIKIVSILLNELPHTNNYQVVFMRRDMREVMASQEAMLKTLGGREVAGEADAERLAAGFRVHLADVHERLTKRSCFRVLYLNYHDVVRNPLEQAEVIARFINRPLDTAAMAAAVEPALHRQRS